MISHVANRVYPQWASTATANAIKFSSSKMAFGLLRSYPSGSMNQLKSRTILPLQRNFHIFSTGQFCRFDNYTKIKGELSAIHQHELVSKIDLEKRERLIVFVAASFGNWTASNVHEIDKEILEILNQDKDFQFTPKEKCILFRLIYCILCKNLGKEK